MRRWRLSVKKLTATSSLLLLVSALPAFAQSSPTDRVSLSVTRAELQIIGQGLMELPYKTVAQVMNNLQAQLNAADDAAKKAAADATKPKEEKPAEVPADPAK